jgi:DNA-directed RNA polymerase specialized sigma24 family protein
VEYYNKYKNLILKICQPAGCFCEDLMQDTFLSFWTNYSHITNEFDIKNLLCIIAKNKLKSFFKEAKYERNSFRER